MDKGSKQGSRRKEVTVSLEGCLEEALSCPLARVLGNKNKAA